MMTIAIAIYGAGGLADEVNWLIESCNESSARYQVVCYIDDNADNHGRTLNGAPVVGLADAATRFPDAQVVGAIGSPQPRHRAMANAAKAGFSFATLVHPRVEHSTSIKIGEGSVICAGNILTTNITLGRQTQINLGCTVGHDVVMEDFATLAPGVHVSGCVRLGQRVYVGTGAVILQGTRSQPMLIGEDAVIGAGAVVNRPVPPGVTVVGVPARPIERR